LPCQAHGIRLAQALNLSITRQVALVIGLFCGFNLTHEGTAYLLRKLGMCVSEVAKLEYRGGPWPGGFRAETGDGPVGFIPKHQYAYVNLMYTPEGCWYCPDLTAEFADLSVGDYWMAGMAKHSMVIARTSAGRALLSGATEREEVTAEPIPYDHVLASHRHLLTYKKRGVQVRRSLSRLRPVAGYQLPPMSVPAWLGSAAFFALLRFGSSRFGRWAIDKVPLSLAGSLSAKGREILQQTNKRRKAI
jgi:coenzyme F420 hydrogenase subunit beta